jgi:hypothetical protein
MSNTFARRTAFSLLAMFLISVPPAAAQTSAAGDAYVPLSDSEKAKVFGQRIIALKSLAKSAFTAAVNQADDSPREWEQNLGGYVRRYSHKLGTRAVKSGIGLLVAMPLQQDPRYFHSDATGVWHRTADAVTNTFLTRTDSGSRSLSLWRITGNYGAQFVSNTWRPDQEAHVSDTLKRATISMGLDAVTNVFKEFWPDIRKHVFRR